MTTAQKIASKPESDTTKSTIEKHFSYFKVEGAYLNNNVYNGRRDSLPVRYLTPSFGYYHKSCLYIKSGFSFANDTAGSRLDLLSFDAGYEFKILENLSASVTANKSFYNQSSAAVQGDVIATLGAGLSYDLNFIEIAAEGGLVFSSKTDYSASFTASHAFSYGEENKNQISITPTIMANYGTQNYTQGYTTRKLKRKVKNRNVTVRTTVESGASDFSILAYDFSIPIAYEAKHWGISFTPYYAIPINLTSTVTKSQLFYANGNPASGITTEIEKESGGNVFYFEVSLFYKLFKDKHK